MSDKCLEQKALIKIPSKFRFQLELNQNLTNCWNNGVSGCFESESNPVYAETLRGP